MIKYKMDTSNTVNNIKLLNKKLDYLFEQLYIELHKLGYQHNLDIQFRYNPAINRLSRVIDISIQ